MSAYQCTDKKEADAFEKRKELPFPRKKKEGKLGLGWIWAVKSMFPSGKKCTHGTLVNTSGEKSH